MPNAADIAWWKKAFGATVTTALANTPFTLDFICALACQETGYIWATLSRKGMATPEILKLCVGDIIDFKSANPRKGRQAFPKNRAELEAFTNGKAMFALARKGFEDMAKQIPGYQDYVANKDKFCRGFGMLQYDLQHFKTNPGYFLNQDYADFAKCLTVCLGELNEAVKSRKLPANRKLTETELASVAVTYNTGGYNPKLGLKQGFKNSDGQYYGELFVAYMRRAATVPFDATPAPVVAVPDHAVVTPPTPVPPTGKRYRIDTKSDPLLLRSAPEKPAAGRKSNVVDRLPDGMIVESIGDETKNGYLRVRTSRGGALLTGWASAQYLTPVPDPTPIPVVVPAPVTATPPLPQAHLPRAAGSITRRTDPPGARSLNEAGQPVRKGVTPAELKASMAQVIAWLAPEKPAHKRYQPTASSTFCNLYAHDYCTLNGVYLPRVWWTPGTLIRIAKGETVAPVYDQTVEEIRANGLFRWLRDFGPGFGWRQTGTLTKLQNEVNQGAVGMIVARRTEEGKSGHIVAVVPETDDHRAIRNTAGEVTHPLQCQAGRTNFSYNTGRKDWWLDAQFAEHAYWIHA